MIKRNWNQCRKMDGPWPWGQDTWIFFLTVISSSHLVKTLLFQPFAKNFSDACKSHDRFFTHGLSHKIFMFLGCWRHGCFRVCFKSLSEMKWAQFFVQGWASGGKDCWMIWQIMDYSDETFKILELLLQWRLLNLKRTVQVIQFRWYSV